jgi:predicted Fe-Mo cluster-binding NifX family protein
MAVTPETTVEKPVVDTRALDDALNTQMSSLPPEVRAASKTRQLAAKAQSDVEQALTTKQREMYEPIESRYREQVLQTQKQVGDIGEQLNKPFEVPKETIADFSALGGLVAIAGAMLGSSGKQSANNVIASMTGIVSGYKKGRADLIQQAFKEFEANMKRLQALSTNAQTQLELASKLSATDKEKAKLLFAEIQAKYNGSIIAAKVAGEDAFNALTAANTIKQTNLAASSNAQRIKEWEAGAETRRLQELKAKQDVDLGPIRQYQGTDGYLYEYNEVTKKITKIEGSQGLTPPSSRGSGVAGGGAVQFRYNTAMASAATLLGYEIENLASSPLAANLPAAGELITKPETSVTGAAVSLLSQATTPAEERALQQVHAGVVRAVATIEASGRPSGATEGAIKKLDSIRPRAGDAKINHYLYLAMLKQVTEIAVKDLQSAGATETQLKQAQTVKDNVAQLINWDVSDINKILRGKNGESLVNDRIRQTIATSQDLNTFERNVNQMTPKPMTRADLQATMKAGNLSEAEALKRLKARGYYLEE